MSGKYGGAGSSGPTSPRNAKGNAPGDQGTISGVPASQSAADIHAGIDVDALDAMLEGINEEPDSLDLALLAPLRDQLEALEDDPDNDWSQDSKFQLVKTTVDAMVTEQLRRMDAFAVEMQADCFEAIQNASSPRQSMIDDERQFRALSRVRDSKRYSSDAPDRDIQDDERICAHTTRTRTTTYAARLGDMIFPTNDYPVRFEAPANPKPEHYPGYAKASADAAAKATQAAQAQYQQAMQSFQQQPGGPQPPPQPPPVNPADALPIKDYAADSSSKFQTWCFEQYDRMHLRRKGRETLERGCKVGLGLWYGPFPEVSRSRVPKMGADGTTLEMEVQETKMPGLEARDPFRFFYDMTSSLEECNAAYYLHLWTLRQLKDFADYPNVIVPNVDLMLEDDPKVDPKICEAVRARSEGSGMKEPLTDRYAVIELDRIIKPEKLKELLGIVWDSPDLPLVKMWIGDSRCLKIKLTPLEHDWRVSYFNFGLMPKDDTIYWYSVPAMGRAAQKGIDGAMNATLFNAAAAVAPIIVANKGQLAPQNERWRLAGMNVFNNLNPDLPAKDVIASVSIQSNVDGNLALFERFLALFDDDVMFEQILGGHIAGEDIAASQLAMLVNLASIWQRRLAANVDDYLMGPFSERMIWWAALYWQECGGDIDMIGPHVVKPIAATQMVSKDILVQHLQAFSALADKPKFAGFSDDYKEFKLHTGLLDVPDLHDIVFDRETALANHQAIAASQTSPDAVKMADVQRQAKKDDAETQTSRMKISAEAAGELSRQKTDLIIQASKERQAMVELMTGKQVDMATIQADLAAASMDSTTQKQLAMLDNTLEARLETLKIFADKAGGASPYSKED